MTVFDKKIYIFHVEFVCFTGPGPLENYKATKQAFDVGPISAYQRNAI